MDEGLSPGIFADRDVHTDIGGIFGGNVYVVGVRMGTVGTRRP